MDEFYGRNMPAPPARVARRTSSGSAQLYARHATVADRDGEGYEPRTWSEIDVVQWTARQPGARAWYEVADEALGERVRDRTVAEMIEAAQRGGRAGARATARRRSRSCAGITTTLGGLRIDERAPGGARRVRGGADAGGIATGGYASGLAAALVFGRIAADSALDG